MCAENWTSLIHTLKKAVPDLDETLLTFIFIIWECLGSSFELFVLICVLIG